MGVRLAPAGAQYVDWGNSPQEALGLSAWTIHFKYNPITSLAAKAILQIKDAAGTDSDEFVQIIQDNLTVYMIIGWSTINGVWQSGNVLTVGQDHKITITYSGSATGNNPLLYVDGVSKTLTRLNNPTGTHKTGKVDNEIYIGSKGTATPNAIIEDLRRYNVIKTAGQAAGIANENLRTSQKIDTAGLRFFAPLTMCKGLTWDTFVGSTLETDNEFYDNVNGYVGVPSGDPVGA